VRLKDIEVAPAEREAFWERLYAEPGFGLWMGNYRDVLVDVEANRLLSEFISRKIAERVDDPAIARRLTPDDHGFGTRRVPLETGYYEVYNQPNVELVDLRATPIVRMTAEGIRTTAQEHALDVVVYATGFDAITGAFDRIDLRGGAGRRLVDSWARGPRTYLSVQTPGFPNLFMLAGPHSATIFCNQPRCIEYNVDWVTNLLRHAGATGASRIEARDEAAAGWTDHALETVDRLLMNKVDSWFHGVNANLPDKPRVPMIYGGGFPLYQEHCESEAVAGYPGFTIG
jgi:cation diffusion facilitator CzcD-associated flavoprotein CzcO